MFTFNGSAKLQEAEDRVRKGEKHLKTSLTKWKPDIDAAIDEFDKACTCYRLAEKYEECRDLSLRLAELHLKKKSLFFAAKFYEQAGQMAQQLKDLSTAGKHFDRAGDLYDESGYRDSGANLFTRCAPLFREFDRSTTIQFYLKAARLAELEDKTHQTADLYEKAAMQVVRTGDFVRTFELLDTVIVLLTKLQRYERINRVILYRVLLKLFNDDSIAARNVFDQACQAHPSFDQWEERDHIQFLIDAFDQNDKDLISQRCQEPYFMAVDPEFVRLMKRWIQPMVQNSTNVVTTQTPTSSSKPIQLADDEEDLR